MSQQVLAVDLSTGGVKVSLCHDDGSILAAVFHEYKTYYPQNNFHEQGPEDWFKAMIHAMRDVLNIPQISSRHVVAISISGHSLCAVPVDIDGNLLTDFTPIWSDKRAGDEAARFFDSIDQNEWYETTGNGFPPECYAIFKIMWLKNNKPDMYTKVHKFLGSKDYINYRLTNKMATDHSYASGSGVYHLLNRAYEERYLKAAGIDKEKFPNLHESHDILGTLSSEMSDLIGLSTNTVVMVGGVDNSVMALGANGYVENSTYLSLGSSAWIAINASKPLLDCSKRPYVFAHCIPGLYTSATSIFAAGSSLRWLRDHLFNDLSYEQLDAMAASANPGANNLIFNPSLAGGAMIEDNPNIVGGFIGLKLGHQPHDLVRSLLEGVAYNLRFALEVLMTKGVSVEQLLVVGGGAKSKTWVQLLADIFGKPVYITGQGLETTTLGAAALAFYGTGIWKDYSPIGKTNKVEHTFMPDEKHKSTYDDLYMISRDIACWLSKTGYALNKSKKERYRRIK